MIVRNRSPGLKAPASRLPGRDVAELPGQFPHEALGPRADPRCPGLPVPRDVQVAHAVPLEPGADHRSTRTTREESAPQSGPREPAKGSAPFGRTAGPPVGDGRSGPPAE